MENVLRLLHENKKIQYYPFCTGQLTQTSESEKLSYLQQHLKDKFGLVSCSFHPEKLKETFTTSVNFGTIIIFKNTNITKVSLQSKTYQFHVDILPAESEQFIAFTSDFQYDIQDIREDILKYYFTFDSKESYSPNEEIEEIIKFIEESVYNDVASFSIFTPDIDINMNFDENLKHVNCYSEISMFLDKVIYAVDIFNSKNCLPVVGMELLVIKKKVKGKKNSPLVVKSKYLNRIKGNFRTKWKKTSHPIYEWNKDANLLESVSIDNCRFGINVIFPQLSSSYLHEMIKKCGENMQKLEYEIVFKIISQALYSGSLEESLGSHNDYFMELVELTKIKKNQKNILLEVLNNCSQQNFPIIEFGIGEMKILSSILGWDNSINILKYISEQDSLCCFGIFNSLTIIDDIIESEIDTCNIEKFRKLLLDVILEYVVNTGNIASFFRGYKHTLFENLISYLLKCKDTSIEDKKNTLIKYHGKLQTLLAKKYVKKGANFTNLNENEENAILSLKDYPSKLTKLIKDLKPRPISYTVISLLGNYLTSKQIIEILEKHYCENEDNFYDATRETGTINKLYLKYFGKRLFMQSTQKINPNITLLIDILGSTPEDIIFMMDKSYVLHYYEVFTKLNEYIGEDIIISFLHNVTHATNYTSFTSPTFIHGASPTKELTKLENEYLKRYVRLMVKNKLTGLHEFISMALFSKDAEFVDEILLECQNTFLVFVDNFAKYKNIMKKEITNFFHESYQLQSKFPTFRIINYVRFILNSIIEKGNYVLEVEADDFCYNQSVISHGCKCHTCKRVIDILDSNVESGILTISNEEVEHVMEEFQSDRISFRTILHNSLKDLVTITPKRYGKERHQLRIRKSPLIPFTLHSICNSVQLSQDLYSRIPSKAKSARTRNLAVNEPPKKIQKIE